jgi:beta-glucanase (GH16 family)
MSARASAQPTAARAVRVRLLACCLIAGVVAAAWVVTHALRSAAGGAARDAQATEISAPGLIWDDEFSGRAGSRPDRSRWEIETGSRNGTLQQYTGSPNNVSLDGHGNLVISAQRNRAFGYTSGAIQTEGRFQTQYGRLEARIKLPSGQGLWPAFWAIGSDYNRVGWPESGEIDVMENFGSNPFKITGSIHGPWRTPHGYALVSDGFSRVSLANAFHVYGAIWSPNRITFTLDGRKYATVTPASLARGQQWVFNKPFFLILNLAVGGQWSGSPGSTRFPESMVIDWVRVYRLARPGSATRTG